MSAPLVPFAVAAALAASFSVPRPPAQPSPLHRLAWLAGCWEGRDGARLVEERWMAPRGGVLLGMSRTLRGDSLVGWEQTRIEARGGRLVFHAAPSGQEPGEFESTAVGDSSVAFANPAHDFPTRVLYRRQGRDSLVARIEGTIGGRERAVDFRFRKVACD
jgi:hypothetical protein